MARTKGQDRPHQQTQGGVSVVARVIGIAMERIFNHLSNATMDVHQWMKNRWDGSELGWCDDERIKRSLEERSKHMLHFLVSFVIVKEGTNK